MRLPVHSRRADWGMIALCSIALPIYLYLGARHGIFWDLSVYERAVSDLGNGVDPYRSGPFLPFVYHPLVLDVFQFVNQVVALRAALVFLYAMSLGWFGCELALWLRSDGRAGAGRRAWVWGVSCCMAASAFGGVGVTSVLCGNMTGFMHFALIAAFLRDERRHGRISGNLPLALTLVFSIIKPYFLLYLLIPLVMGRLRRLAIVRAGAALVAFGGLWLLLAQLDPNAYAAFIAALKYQSLGKSDLGYSFFATFRRVVHNDWAALAMHGVACAVLLALATGSFVKRAGRERSVVPALFLLYMVLTVANPRMKEYDLFPALVCFFIFIRAVLPRSDWIIASGLAVSSIPLLVNAVRAAGIVFPALSGASNTWQIMGLVAIGTSCVVTTIRLGAR